MNINQQFIPPTTKNNVPFSESYYADTQKQI